MGPIRGGFMRPYPLRFLQQAATTSNARVAVHNTDL
jgi:hypothetical protein